MTPFASQKIDGLIADDDDSNLGQEIAWSLLSANTSHDFFPYISRTVRHFPIVLVWW